ncbi:MAG TPA: ABC transporter substrate-binding protein [Acidimicrobiales bacterium]|nr:ABC transporter substrate-binding protein [Acidimicrobiales bacterium]
MTRSARARRWVTELVVLAAVGGALAACGGGAGDMLSVGAVFPLHGMQSTLATQELRGVQIAADLANRQGGVGGRPIRLVVRDLETRDGARAAVDSLQRAGVPLVVGAFSSQLSMPAAAAAASDGLVYWEAGAVADRLTGQGSPLVFRVGATGANLGANSGRFAATQLAPRLGLAPDRTRVAVVYENDAYGQSVAGAAASAVRQAGMPVVADVAYDYYSPHWATVLGQVAAARPDVLILASYIPDGVAFRRAMLAAHLRVGALIGSTMAECGPNFGDELGPQAVGVFASDRPEGGFNPGALDRTGRQDYAALVAAWRSETGQSQPTEEALAGFAAGWALFHYVLPHSRGLTPTAIAAAARATTLPVGRLPNGAGLRFAAGSDVGQNLLASAVIWQWQAPRHSVVVWPAAYATGSPRFVPLPA